MEMKRATSLVLVSAMTAGLLAGCGSGGAQQSGDVSSTAESTASATSEAAATADTQAAAAEKPEVSRDEEMTFEIYDAALMFIHSSAIFPASRPDGLRRF